MRAHGAQVAPPATDEETLEGDFERIVYEAPKGDFFVGVLRPIGQAGEARVVGDLAGAKPGEHIRCFGHWVNDARYGRQFRVATFQPVLPSSPVGMERYLASAGIKGIGKKMATRIVSAFGADTFEVLQSSPGRLLEVDGLGRARAHALADAFAQQRAAREVMVFLHGHGLGPALARKICKAYGERAITLVRENPYRLARDVQGIGFRTADRLGRSLGYDARSPERAAAATLHVLETASDDGHLFLPLTEVAQRCAKLEVDGDVVPPAVQRLCEAGEIIVEGAPDDAQASVYLPRYHRAELQAADRLERLLHTPGPALYARADDAIASFESRTGLVLSPGQRAAISRALESKVFVLTGGPGTGKTTIISALIVLTQGRGLKVELCAPTGRAAKRLEEASGQQARTLHRLLEFNPRSGGFLRGPDNLLQVDTVIVDESSMIDLPLFNSLLRAMPASARLVLVGDVDQLPSVGAGDVLRDVIASGVVPVARLSEIFRQAGGSAIVQNAHRINRGELPNLEEGADSDFFHIDRSDGQSAAETILTLVQKHIPRRFNFHPLKDVQVLAPMYKGAAGVERLNLILQAALNPRPGQSATQTAEELLLGAADAVEPKRRLDTLRVGDKVIQTRNNYQKEVFNGDVGLVSEIDHEETLVVVEFEGRAVEYEGEAVEELQLAYALSVHKSQGSEYPVVILSLSKEHFPMLQRNLLYTAVTRGKRLVVVVGARRALELAVQNAKTRERHSKLAERVRALVLQHAPE